MTDCRGCDQSGTLRLARPRGFWEEKVLGRLGIVAIRCVSCGARRLRLRPALDGDVADPAGVGQRPQVTFLEPEAESDFDDLVEGIRSTEQRVTPDGRE